MVLILSLWLLLCDDLVLIFDIDLLLENHAINFYDIHRCLFLLFDELLLLQLFFNFLFNLLWLNLGKVHSRVILHVGSTVIVVWVLLNFFELLFFLLSFLVLGLQKLGTFSLLSLFTLGLFPF